MVSRWRLVRDRIARLWHTDNPRAAMVRDAALSGVVIFVLLGAIWVYSGQPLSRAPVVSIESGSMMHGPDPPFGRIGSIEPGDIVLVKDIDEAEDARGAFDARARSTYGAPGDVAVFQPFGDPARTRIIHRLMLYVEANKEGCIPSAGGPDGCVYRVPAACDARFAQWNHGADLSAYCEGSSLPMDLRLERDGVRIHLDAYPCADAACEPFYSSFITKGDNNPTADQGGPNPISSPVRPSWIMGKARGEIPWFGLIKLALYGNPNYQPETDPSGGANWKILAARAPSDIWTCLFLALGAFIAVPLVLDWVGNSRRRGGRRS